ncbi:MAG: OmpA family protein [Ferruginibacter sp.]
MKQLLSIAVVCIGSSLLFSCGAGKKLTAANAANAELNSLLTEQSAKLADGVKETAQLKAENIQYSREAEDCRKLKAAVQEKLDNLNKNLAEKGTSMKQIEEKAAAAISKFEDAGATVTYKNGMVHINFEDDFFFNTNSSIIAAKGREALNTVAQVMRENPGVSTIIVGNTDTLSIKGKADNWSLSTERANAVVRILHDVYNINPARLTAAGRSKYNPVAKNDTEEGRKKNRRIEIIINPDMSRIWDLMD